VTYRTTARVGAPDKPVWTRPTSTPLVVFPQVSQWVLHWCTSIVDRKSNLWWRSSWIIFLWKLLRFSFNWNILWCSYRMYLLIGGVYCGFKTAGRTKTERWVSTANVTWELKENWSLIRIYIIDMFLICCVLINVSLYGNETVIPSLLDMWNLFVIVEFAQITCTIWMSKSSWLVCQYFLWGRAPKKIILTVHKPTLHITTAVWIAAYLGLCRRFTKKRGSILCELLWVHLYNSVAKFACYGFSLRAVVAVTTLHSSRPRKDITALPRCSKWAVQSF
jgi:hypothetical protein